MSFESTEYDVDQNGAAPVGETVLIVDDSRSHRMLLRRILQRWGYTTIEAACGADAIKTCQVRDIRLVVSDWMMPGMSGVEFCRAYRAMTNGRPGYFILLTAQTERAVLAEGLESGADDFLSKPFNSIELRARLRAGQRIVGAQRDLAAKNEEVSHTLHQLSEAYSAIDRDLREARKFQESFVPNRHISMSQTEISLLFRPSGHVGGDMVGYFKVSDDEMGIYAVDVSGHGVGSALMTARIASYFSDTAPERNIAMVRSDDGYAMLPPDETCAKLNSLLQKDVDSDLYLTMFLARFSMEKGEMTICQAGHPSPLLIGADGKFEFQMSFGMPIGLIDGAVFDTFQIVLQPGDRLLIHSDGFTECPDAEGNPFDEDGLMETIGQIGHLTGPDMLAALERSLQEFAGGANFPDDLSAVLIERR